MNLQPQTRTLHLYGDLAKRFGKTHKVCVETLSEAIRIVECNHPGFLRRVRNGQFHCLRGDKTLKRSTEMHPHQTVIPSRGDLHLIPVASGAKSRGLKIVFSIVVGGALLATGIGGALGAFGAGATGLGVAGTSLAISFTTLSLMGAGILLGGLSMLLAPTPKGEGERKQTSFTFDAPVNAGDEGGPVPLLYGELIVGSVTIASDIRTGYGSFNGGTTGYTKFGSGGTGTTVGGGTGTFDTFSVASV